jgi:hypothetical protein
MLTKRLESGVAISRPPCRSLTGAGDVLCEERWVRPGVTKASDPLRRFAVAKRCGNVPFGNGLRTRVAARSPVETYPTTVSNRARFRSGQPATDRPIDRTRSTVVIRKTIPIRGNPCPAVARRRNDERKSRNLKHFVQICAGTPIGSVTGLATFDRGKGDGAAKGTGVILRVSPPIFLGDLARNDPRPLSSPDRSHA